MLQLVRRWIAADPPWLVVYAVPLLAAELTLLLGDPFLGVALHGATLLVAALHTALARSQMREVAVAALLPLTRLLSIVIPIEQADPSLLYVMVGAPLLLATVLVAWRVDPRVLSVGLGRRPALLEQAVIAGFGFPIGWLMLQAGVAGPLAAVENRLLLVVTAVLFVALFEELLYRGLIQHAYDARSPLLGVLVPNALYAIMYAGTASPEVIIAMTAVGLLFSICVWLSGSLWGVVVAHAIARIILGLA